MEVNIYKTKKRPNTFLFTKKGTNLSDLAPDLDDLFLDSPMLWKTKIINSDSELIGASPEKIINNIENHGYHCQAAGVTIGDDSKVGAVIGASTLGAAVGSVISPMIGAAVAAIAGLSAVHFIKSKSIIDKLPDLENHTAPNRSPR